MKWYPLLTSKRSIAVIRPIFPSLIRSTRSIPWFWYFFATFTTKRRFALTIFAFAILSPCAAFVARSVSSSWVRSGILLISLRYIFKTLSSLVIILNLLECSICKSLFERLTLTNKQKSCQLFCSDYRNLLPPHKYFVIFKIEHFQRDFVHCGFRNCSNRSFFLVNSSQNAFFP